MQIDPKILKTDEKVAYSLRSIYRRFGYSQFKMSKFEEYALYIKNKDFLVSDGIISFTDTNGRLLALKPDVTLSIINNSKTTGDSIQKLYYDENVYRISKSSRSFKEIRQTGLECIGNVGFLEVCEVLSLAVKSLESISENFVFELSHIGLLEAVLEQCGLEEKSKQILPLINSKNLDDLKTLVSDDKIFGILSVFVKNFGSFGCALSELAAVCESEKAKEQLEEFKSILSFIEDMGYKNNTKVDFSLANDMNYYCGVVFRGYIEGIPVGVLSGGQYDKLMRKMGRKAGAIGFAVYLDTLERYNMEQKQYDVDTLLLCKGSISDALKKADELSKEGVPVRICTEIPENLRYRQLIEL